MVSSRVLEVRSIAAGVALRETTRKSLPGEARQGYRSWVWYKREVPPGRGNCNSEGTLLSEREGVPAHPCCLPEGKVRFREGEAWPRGSVDGRRRWEEDRSEDQ